MADITERIEKQMEGTNLALAAVAEVLQKMDGRLAQEEAVEIAKAQEDANASARANLVKSIPNEVLAVIKDTEGKGMPVSGAERKAKSTGGTPTSADDSESAASIGSKTEDAQNTIQAMRKGEWGNGNGDDEEDELTEDKKVGLEPYEDGLWGNQENRDFAFFELFDDREMRRL